MSTHTSVPRRQPNRYGADIDGEEYEALQKKFEQSKGKRTPQRGGRKKSGENDESEDKNVKKQTRSPRNVKKQTGSSKITGKGSESDESEDKNIKKKTIPKNNRGKGSESDESEDKNTKKETKQKNTRGKGSESEESEDRAIGNAGKGNNGSRKSKENYDKEKEKEENEDEDEFNVSLVIPETIDVLQKKMDSLKEYDTSNNATKKFKFAALRLHLTYAATIDPEELVDFLKKKITKEIVNYSVVNEIGDKKQHKHTHALISFVSQWQCTAVRKLDYDGKHPNWNAVQNDVHWWNCVKYHYKSSDPYTNIELKEVPSDHTSNYRARKKIDIIQNSKTIEEAYRNAVTMGKDGKLINVLETKILFESKNKDNHFSSEDSASDDINFYTWQRNLIGELWDSQNSIGHKADRDTIIWYVDKIGGTGKSTFTRKWCRKNNFFVTDATTPSTIATAIKNYRSTPGSTMRYMFFDLSRSKNFDEIYETLESLKNGCLTVTKYNSHVLTWNKRTWVVVFSNHHPCSKKLSLRRWSIRTISQNPNRKNDYYVSYVKTFDDMQTETSDST